MEFEEEHNFHCSASIINPKYGRLRKWSAISAILSSSASVVGCLLIIVTYWCWRDLRTTSRTILLYVAIADLATALGYIFGSSTYLHCEFYHVTLDRCNNDTYKTGTGCQESYPTLCKWQSFITTWSSISSFFWTTILAFYLYMTIVHKKYRLVRKMMPLFHVFSWGVGLALCIAAVLKNWLGPSLDDTAVSWCFVSDNHYNNSQMQHIKYFNISLMQLLLGKGWEMTCYVLIVGFYLATKIYIEIEKRRPLHYPVYATVLKLDKKVLFIPMVFLLVRVWGTIRFIISWSPLCEKHKECHSVNNFCSCENILYHPLIVFLQAIGDGAQGWGNAILFVIFSAKVRGRLKHSIKSASWKLNSTSSRHEDTTDYGTINPREESPTVSLTAATPTLLYSGSISPRNVK